MAKEKSKPKKGGADSESAKAALVVSGPPRMKTLFDQTVRPKVSEKFGVANAMAMPKIDKVVININMGRHLDGTKLPPNVKSTVIDTLTAISGQKPVIRHAKKSVSNFKVREGYESSAMVTLRRERMWHFLDRLIHLATPRIKDFRGLNDKAFDRQGSYSMGLNEQGVFPEINMAEVTFTHGMNINVCFKNSTPEMSRFVLAELGMPFRKPEDGKSR
ncbi:MAG: 50S ribosomal protein L5 [Phycisphaeraceae bacterium]|nr:50S ribosomal protein L5 [Phycisphaeraceae bacterium]MCW5762961.1 50S ribosomal protein L5 [Phycisphaeraceae bacterium]